VPGDTVNAAGTSRHAEAWVLGKLVTFDKRRRSPRPRTDVTGTGEVVIFTGVRYERSSDPVSSGGSNPLKPKRKRG
jgi:hypothetical protein